MEKLFRRLRIPQSRIATFDVMAIGQARHHVSALLEFDVTDSRSKLRELKRKGEKVSFNAWLLKVIARTLAQHPEAAAFLRDKKTLIAFNDINISILVEKMVGDKKVPIPLVIKKANEKSVTAITSEIEEGRSQSISEKDLVLNRQSRFYERLYYHLPGFIRRTIWRMILSHPAIAYKNMGNAVITSLGMMGRINGWFIHNTVHPISFGVGSVLKKPVVINDKIEVREILNMTILFDHDIIDGAQMVRLVNSLTRSIENGEGLSAND